MASGEGRAWALSLTAQAPGLPVRGTDCDTYAVQPQHQAPSCRQPSRITAAAEQLRPPQAQSAKGSSALRSMCGLTASPLSAGLAGRGLMAPPVPYLQSSPSPPGPGTRQVLGNRWQLREATSLSKPGQEDGQGCCRQRLCLCHPSLRSPHQSDLPLPPPPRPPGGDRALTQRHQCGMKSQIGAVTRGPRETTCVFHSRLPDVTSQRAPAEPPGHAPWLPGL